MRNPAQPSQPSDTDLPESQRPTHTLLDDMTYDAWFRQRVETAFADKRPTVMPAEWKALKAKKLALREALMNV